jgi:4-amino-4-deoxy-L-arabinose transferase-like glycosyltransferase
LALMGYALLITMPPFNMILGGVDPGVYVNTAAHIRASGAILIHDPIVFAAARVPEINQTFLPWPEQYLPGFYLLNDVIIPQFYHAYPALLAFVGSFLGSQVALYVTPLLALLNSLGLFLLVRRWWRRTATAVLAVAVLATNVSFVWFARYANSEVLALQFFLSGLLALSFAEESATARAAQGWGSLSAAFLGGAFLTRIDMIFLFPALIIGWLMFVWRDKFRLAVTWILTLGIFIVWTFIHVYFFSFPYFYDVLYKAVALPFLRKHAVFSIVAGLALIGLLLALTWALKSTSSVRHAIEVRVCQIQALLFPATVLLLLGLTACYYFFHWEILSWLAWYCGVPALGLSFVGILSWSKDTSKRSPVPVSLALFFVACLTAIIVLGPNPKVNIRHFWASRRLLVFVFPLVSVLAAHGLSKGIRWMGKLGGTGLVAIALIPGIYNIRPLIHFQMYQNAPQDLKGLAEHIPQNSIVLCGPAGEEKTATPLRFLYGLHAFGFGRRVVTAEALDALTKTFPNRELILVTIAPEYPRIESPYGLKGDPIISIPMKWPEFDEPEDRLPRSYHTLEGTLELWRIYKRGPTDSFQATAARLETSGVEVHGLYGADPRKSSRWTNGHAQLVLPREIVQDTRMLYIDLSDNRPQAVETEILLNSRKLGSVRVERGRVTTFSYLLPVNWLDESESARLELRTPTWSPAGVNGSTDTRKLGVMLLEVHFEK